MKIKYIVARASSLIPKMSYRNSTHITSAIYRQNHQQTSLTIKDIISIFFEQTTLTDYLLDMNPTNQLLLNYRSILRHNFDQYFKQNEINDDLLLQQQLSSIDIQLLKSFIISKQNLPGSSLNALVNTFTGTNQCQYASVPKDFTIPYLSLKSDSLFALNKGKEYLNPLVLSPVCRKDKQDPADITITMYVRPYTSMRCVKSHPFGKNTTLAYICAMNHTGRNWKELIDTVQSLHVKTTSPTGAFESLSGVLHHYFHGKSLPAILNSKPYSQQLIQVLRYVIENNIAVLNKDPNDISQLCEVFKYLKDNRLTYLPMVNPIVAAKEQWDRQFDLKFLSEYSLIGYGMEADKPDDSGEDPSDNETSADPDEPTDSDGEDNPKDGEDGEDPFDDGDLTAGDENDEGDGDGSDTSADTSSSSSSDSSSSSSSDTSSDSSGVDPEDVNPLIELIDDETFDEYLDRGTLQHRIKVLINNPPSSISNQDVEFLKYWFIQWFSCVSVATTREILGDLLELPVTQK